MTLNIKNHTVDKNKRKTFQTNEIFFSCYFLIKQAKFSNALNYFSFTALKNVKFKTQYRNSCIMSKSQHSVLVKYKLKHQMFTKYILQGKLPGFQKSVF